MYVKKFQAIFLFQPEIVSRPYWITMHIRKVNRENGYQRRVCLFVLLHGSIVWENGRWREPQYNNY